MAGVNSFFCGIYRAGNLASAHFSSMCCVVTEFVYAITIIPFHLGE